MGTKVDEVILLQIYMEYLKVQEQNIFTGKQANNFSFLPHRLSDPSSLLFNGYRGPCPTVQRQNRDNLTIHPPSIRNDLPGLDADRKVKQVTSGIEDIQKQFGFIWL